MKQLVKTKLLLKIFFIFLNEIFWKTFSDCTRRFMYGASNTDASSTPPSQLHSRNGRCRQVALYMLRHPYKYFKCVEQELLRTGESYESYCYNVLTKTFGEMTS